MQGKKREAIQSIKRKRKKHKTSKDIIKANETGLQQLGMDVERDESNDRMQIIYDEKPFVDDEYGFEIYEGELKDELEDDLNQIYEAELKVNDGS